MPSIFLTEVLNHAMQENVRQVIAPVSRPSLQHVFIPPKIREYFDLKVRDLPKFDTVEKGIVIKKYSDYFNLNSLRFIVFIRNKDK